MAMKTLTATDLMQAYSVNSWAYTDWDAAYAGYANASLTTAALLRFSIPSFTGLSEALNVTLVCKQGVGSDVTLRWAICTSDANKSLYENTKAAVSDSYQIASGTVTVSDMSTSTVTRTLTLATTKITGGKTYYLFLWGYNSTGLSIWGVSTAYGDHSITLGYNVGVVRIKTSSGVKMYAVYNGAKQQLIPYVMTSSGAKPCG